MANLVIVGMQWGDEGKGKVVDLVCPAFDAVVRYQGGHNAGHTVRFGERHFSLHLIPSGILFPGMACAMGNGMVVAPDAFFTELGRLEAAGVEVRGRLFVAARAHAVLAPAVALDVAREAARGAGKIGTTSRGIGPSYENKTSRFGLRLCDLGAADLEARLEPLFTKAAAELAFLGAPGLGEMAALAERCRQWHGELAPFLADTEWLLNSWVREGKSLLLEGAQGTLLDVDHGTFPFVTSSNSTAGGAATGTGLPPTAITGVLGVLKAYSTRVGGGPFTTELHDDVGDFLRQRGNEFGTTTGRPRRCGWLDFVASRYAVRLNGIGGIALTKLDVLDQLAEIPVCVGYRQGGVVHRDYGVRFESGEPFEPVYESMPGWQSSTTGARCWEDLPSAAGAYVRRIEDELGVPVLLISTGPRREETILCESPAFAALLGGRADLVTPARA